MVDNLPDMSEKPTLYYHRTEIESFLPTGWKLGEDGGAGIWDGSAQSWSTSLFDGVDYGWPLAVTASEAEKLGRIEALRAAILQVFNARLGNHTRGLGRG